MVTELCVCVSAHLKEGGREFGVEMGVSDWLCDCSVQTPPHHKTPGGHDARLLLGTSCSYYLFIASG